MKQSTLSVGIRRPDNQIDWRHELHPGEYVVGRQSNIGRDDTDIVLSDSYLSRRHCRIFFSDNQWWVIDLQSRNGTLLDDRSVKDAARLHNDSVLVVGATTIMFRITENADEEDQKQTAAIAHEETVSCIDEHSTLVLPDEQQSFQTTTVLPQEQMEDEATAIIRIADEKETACIGEHSTLVLPDEQQSFQTTAVLPQKQMEGETAASDVLQTAADIEEEDQPSTPSSPMSADDQSIDQALSDPFIQSLVNGNYLAETQVRNILQTVAAEGGTFFSALMEHEMVRRKLEIFQLAAQSLNIREIITDSRTLLKEAASSENFTFQDAYACKCILLRSYEPDKLHYGVTDPFDITKDDLMLRTAAGKQQVAPKKTLIWPEIFEPCCRKLIQRSMSGDADEAGVIIDLNTKQCEALREQIDDVSVPKIVDYLIFRAKNQGASDIHIEPTENRLLIRNRVDGMLHEELSLSSELHSELSSRVKIMSGINVAERRLPQDGRIGVVIEDSPIDIRVSTYPTVYGEKIVLRLLDPNTLRPSIMSLGLLDRDLRMLVDKINAPFGLLMISGPTGSGKSTTLYSCLSDLDKGSKNVLTIEDPVEYRLEGTHQMQVNERIGLTFARGLRTILRQDPDVVMVGECRDLETAAMAVHAALTGHIVFSTIHANDAVGVITRLLDMGIEPFLVASALSLSMAQRLVRKICLNCKKAVLGKDILKNLNQNGIRLEKLEKLGITINPDYGYAQGEGCSRCHQTGYRGRQAVFEIFELNNRVRDLILSHDVSADKLRDLAKDEGMTTLISHGLTLIEDEITTFEEVIRVLGESY